MLFVLFGQIHVPLALGGRSTAVIHRLVCRLTERYLRQMQAVLGKGVDGSAVRSGPSA